MFLLNKFFGNRVTYYFQTCFVASDDLGQLILLPDHRYKFSGLVYAILAIKPRASVYARQLLLATEHLLPQPLCWSMLLQVLLSSQSFFLQKELDKKNNKGLFILAHRLKGVNPRWVSSKAEPNVRSYVVVQADWPLSEANRKKGEAWGPITLSRTHP